jgi:hypothetical protein
VAFSCPGSSSLARRGHAGTFRVQSRDFFIRG